MAGALIFLFLRDVMSAREIAPAPPWMASASFFFDPI